MSTPSTSQKNEFNIPTKGKRLIPSTTDELICDNCINAQLISFKHSPYPFYDTASDPLALQSKLNNLTQNKINSKIQQRLHLSEQVSKSLQPNTQKDRLITQNEKGTFYLNDPSILSTDHVKARALEKYKQRLSNNNVNAGKPTSDKPKVDNYYQYYVDNYITPVKQDTTDKSEMQRRYTDDLNKQIETNKLIKNNLYKDEDAKLSSEQQKDYDKYMKLQNEENKKRQQMNEEFVRGNRNLILLKNKRMEQEKKQNDYDECIKAEKLVKEMEEEDAKKRNNVNLKRKQLQMELDNQVKEKENKKGKDNERDVNVNVNGDDCGGFCKCESNSYGVCASCQKSYPMTFLNVRRNFKNLAQVRLEKKGSDLKY